MLDGSNELPVGDLGFARDVNRYETSSADLATVFILDIAESFAQLLKMELATILGTLVRNGGELLAQPIHIALINLVCHLSDLLVLIS